MASVWILLLFCLNIQFVYSNNPKIIDISCDTKITSKPFHHQEFECRDFSASGHSNKIIASCELKYYAFPMFRFGWNYDKNVENNWVHPISIEEPTDRSCSMKLNLHNDITETTSKFYDEVKGKMQHCPVTYDHTVKWKF